MLKNFVGEYFGYRTKLCIRRGYHYSPLKNFSFTQPIKFVGEPFCFSVNSWYRKDFMDERGISRFFSRFFLSHRTETKSFVREPFCFPENFWYRKTFMDERGDITIFRRKFFCLTVPKNFVGEPFCVSQNFWYRKNLRIRGGRGGGREYRDFLSKFFRLTVPKNFVREPFCVSENFWYKEFFG